MFTIITDIGMELFAEAQANGSNAAITHMAAGDLNEDQYINFTLYDGTEIALHDEKTRVEMNRVFVDPEDATQVIFEAIIKPSTGGWHIREVGLFDDAGNLIAIAQHPEMYIPDTVDSGLSVDTTVQFCIKLENAETVNVLVNLSAALASQQYVQQMLLGQAATSGLRDLQLSEEIALLKTKI